MATHSSILAWRIPWTEEPDRLQSIGSQRVRQTEQLTLCLSLFTIHMIDFLRHMVSFSGCFQCFSFAEPFQSIRLCLSTSLEKNLEIFILIFLCALFSLSLHSETLIILIVDILVLFSVCFLPILSISHFCESTFIEPIFA